MIARIAINSQCPAGKYFSNESRQNLTPTHLRFVTNKGANVIYLEMHEVLVRIIVG